MKEKLIEEYNIALKNKSPEEILQFFLKEYGNKIGFSSSFGAEDQVITEMISRIDKTANIFTLDTGRLFPETYKVMEATRKKYGINVNVYFPDYKEVEKMVKENGINLFYESIENRKLCCRVRKLNPLKRAFSELDAWICGLRRDQSVTRNDIKLVEWDKYNQMIKVNPIYDWTEEMVWKAIRTKDIPYNELHDKGFASIGCQPCTRAIKPGEDIRSGRWWWEKPENKECGLHVK